MTRGDFDDDTSYSDAFELALKWASRYRDEYTAEAIALSVEFSVWQSTQGALSFFTDPGEFERFVLVATLNVLLRAGQGVANRKGRETDAEYAKLSAAIGKALARARGARRRVWLSVEVDLLRYYEAPAGEMGIVR